MARNTSLCCEVLQLAVGVVNVCGPSTSKFELQHEVDMTPAHGSAFRRTEKKNPWIPLAASFSTADIILKDKQGRGWRPRLTLNSS